ncbi:MAG: OmpA family protein, partial [Bacteroidota bacterium]|nr:OmpA family protein [Bacteroidota bacterium]
QKDLGISGRSKKQVLDAIRKQREAEALLLQRHIEDSIRSQQSNHYIVYFDLNKAVLTKADKVVLDSMVNVLQAHSTLNVVVGSFTDCSGSIRYNMKLSAKRSNASLKYILAKGIAHSRITESHYGKQYLVERCKTRYNVKQQMPNRRTELILTEKTNKKWHELYADTTIGKSVYSAITAKKVVTINKVHGNAEKEPALVNDKHVVVTAKGNIHTEFKKPTPLKTNLPVGNKVEKPAVPEKAITAKTSEKKAISKDPKPLKAAQQLQPRKDSIVRVIAADARSEAAQENAQRKQELISVLDSLARLKSEQERIVTYLTKRINKTPIPIYTAADSVTIEIYDSGIHDNDSVSVIYNKRLVVDRKELMVDRPIKFVVKVDKNPKNNELVVVAENLGTEPPNTAVLVITDKYNKRQEVMLSTDLTHNEVVYFIKIMKDKK